MSYLYREEQPTCRVCRYRVLRKTSYLLIKPWVLGEAKSYNRTYGLGSGKALFNCLAG